MNNPFVTKGYAGPDYFCDRCKETKDMVDLIVNDNNIALISPRRLGKTDLIRHCFEQTEIKDHYYTFLIDIYATSSINDFVFTLGKTILDELKPKGRKVWELFWRTVKSVQSEVSFDINGNPVWGIGVGNTQNPSVTLEEIFTYLNNADKPCVVAVDEFQQITKYGNNGKLEATLRTYIQRCNRATFVFAGSKRHLMGEIFTSPSRPFYQSVITMGLAPISVDAYTEFAVSLFLKFGKSVSPDAVRYVYQQFNGVTSCLQRVMNVMFLKADKNKVCGIDDADEAIDYVLDFLSEGFESQLEQMPEKQKRVFMTIAFEHEVENITSGAFFHKHKMLSPSSVASAVKALLDKELITRESGKYRVYDSFFERWVNRDKK